MIKRMSPRSVTGVLRRIRERSRILRVCSLAWSTPLPDGQLLAASRAVHHSLQAYVIFGIILLATFAIIRIFTPRRTEAPAAEATADGGMQRIANGHIRCLLFPNPLLVQTMGVFSLGKKQRLLRSAAQPRLAIDMDADTIRVVDMNSSGLVAQAQAAQVTATPATYRPRPWWRGWGGNPVSDGMYRTLSITPLLIVQIPDFSQLTIATRASADSLGIHRRFSWHDAPEIRVPADYAVSGEDFVALAQQFGLGPYLQTHT